MNKKQGLFLAISCVGFFMFVNAPPPPRGCSIAWHSAGTFDKADGSGGTNGGTMRFEPEKSDGANAGLHIIHDLLLPIKKRHPEVSYGDLWAMAGACAVEFAGGPAIPFELGRVDVRSGGSGAPFRATVLASGAWREHGEGGAL